MKIDEFSLTHDHDIAIRAVQNLPSDSQQRKTLYMHLISLSEGTTTVDKDRGFRPMLAVGGFGILEPYFKAIPQEAIDDGTIHSVRGVHYNFEEHMGGSHTETGIFFEFDKSNGGYNIELSPEGCIALKILEAEHKEEMGTAAAIIKRNYIDKLNQDLEAGGHAPIAWPIQSNDNLENEPEGDAAPAGNARD